MDKMDKACINCTFYKPHPRKLRYPKGQCQRQYAYRKSDHYKIHLDIITPHEYVCDMFKEKERLVYALVEGEAYLIPPIVAKDLIDKGWVLIERSGNLQLEHKEKG